MIIEVEDYGFLIVRAPVLKCEPSQGLVYERIGPFQLIADDEYPEIADGAD